MDDKLVKVKLVFDKVKKMRGEITVLFDGLDGRITKLCEIYNEFIRNTKKIKTPDPKAFIFSLDSFYFQNSLLKREFKNLKDYNTIIINRMYGEYYKLYKLITDFIEKSHIDDNNHELVKKKMYPKYDDLDEEKIYDFNLIIQLNDDIMNIVNFLIKIKIEKEMSLKTYQTNQSFGLNVNNFVSTFNYEVIVLSEQIILFENYLDFFYHIHEKLFKRLILKISVLEAQLSTDIKFEGGIIGKRKDNNSLMEDMNIKGLNKKTARDLRQSITGKMSPSFSVMSNSMSSDFSSIDEIPINTSSENNNPDILKNIKFDEMSITKMIFNNHYSDDENEVIEQNEIITNDDEEEDEEEEEEQEEVVVEEEDEEEEEEEEEEEDEEEDEEVVEEQKQEEVVEEQKQEEVVEEQKP